MHQGLELNKTAARRQFARLLGKAFNTMRSGANTVRQLPSRSGVNAVREGVRTQINYSRPFKAVKSSPGPGPFQAERVMAAETAKDFQKAFNPKEFSIYAGRVKSPASIQHREFTESPPDLLGYKVTSRSGKYDESEVANLMDLLRQKGMQIDTKLKIMAPGYHGYNILGKYKNTPIEVQLTPRRLQGLGQMDHSLVYKPHESGVAPWVGKHLYSPVISNLMNAISPMATSANRWRSRAMLGTIGAGAGVGAYHVVNNLPEPSQPNSFIATSRGR